MRLWSVAAYLLLPYALVGLVWRGVRYPAYFRRWPERLGFVRRLTGERVVWIHAVSVGEVRSAAGFIREIMARLPRCRILVTTMTPTGAEQVRALFGDHVVHSYLPYDFPGAVARFLDRVRPEFAIVAETEFWPNLFHACRRRNIPLHLVNARISPASFRGYARVRRTAQRMFATAEGICAQSTLDAQRLRNLGVDDRLISVTGNLKFDAELPNDVQQRGDEFRRQWGGGRRVLVAASTHPGEERQVLDAFADLRQQYPDLLLVLVPRHPERFATVTRLSRRLGFETRTRSELTGPLAPECPVLIGDTMGELLFFYAASDLAFIGGSLVPHGGQNPLEAFSVGVPAVFGPHMFHFEEIGALSLERGAARQVADAAGLADAVALYFDQPALRRAAAAAALELIRENQGSLGRTLRAIRRPLAAMAAGAGQETATTRSAGA